MFQQFPFRQAAGQAAGHPMIPPTSFYPPTWPYMPQVRPVSPGRLPSGGLFKISQKFQSPLKISKVPKKKFKKLFQNSPYHPTYNPATVFRLRPDVARYTNTLARKNTDGKLKKKQKNLKKNSTETNSNSKPEEKGNSREEKINEVESQVRMGSVWVQNQGWVE